MHEYYSAEKKEWIIDSYNIDESQYNCANWKQSDKKEYILNDSIYIKFQKMQMILYGDRKQISGCWEE